MFSALYGFIYIGLFIVFLIAIIFYRDAKKLWVKVIVWLLMLPFILSTTWMIYIENFYK